MLAGFGGLRGPWYVQLVGQRIVDRVDVGVGEQLLIRAIGGGNLELLGRSLAFATSREAIAATVVSSPCCIAGITFLRPMFAVLRTPKRSFVVIEAS
jgi:hypothetical protein